MKNYYFLVLGLFLFSCGDNDPEMPAADAAILEYQADNGESFQTDNPSMSYDSLQLATFIKFDDASMKVRCNFRGRDIGMYTDDNAIFYKFGINADQSQTVDILCDTYTGIQINVTEYGSIGEYISGDFTALNCDGDPDIQEVSGTFRVMRTE